jgi:hypothetical protein
MAIQINSFTPSVSPAYSLVGGTVTFSVDATETNGVALQYQWQSRSPGAANFTNILGATSSSYTTPSNQVGDSGTFYRVSVFTVSPGQQVFAPNTTGIELRVVTQPIINVVSPLETFYFSEIGNSVDISVVTTFDSESALEKNLVDGISFQWQVSGDDGQTWNNLNPGPSVVVNNFTTDDGAVFFRNSVLTLQNLTSSQNLNRYRVIISSSIALNSPFTHGNALLVVSPTITITKQPGTSPDVTEIIKGGETTLTVDAVSNVGNNSTLSYQWYFQTNNIQPRRIEDGNNLTLFDAFGAQSKTLTIRNVDLIQGFKIYVEIAGTFNEPDVTSDVVTITINQFIVIDTEVSDTFSLEDKYGNIPNRLSFPESIQNAEFFVQVLDDDKGSIDTSTSGEIQIRWQRQDPGSSDWYYVDEFAEISSYSTYFTPPLRIDTDNGARYRAEINATNALNGPYYSPQFSGAELTVFRQLYYSTQPNNANVIIGQSASFSVSAETSSPSTIFYQWQVSTNYNPQSPQLATWQNIVNNSTYTGANTNLLLIDTVTASLDNTYYRNIITADNTLSSVTSSVVSLRTFPDVFTSISQLNDLFLLEGELLFYTVSAQSVSLSEIQYQWQKSINYNPINPNAATWNNISGATSNELIISSVSISDSAYYRLRLTSNGGIVEFTNVGQVSVTQLTISVIRNYPLNVSVLEEQSPSFEFSVTATPSISASLFYRWQYSIDNGINWINYPLNGGVDNSSSTNPTFIPPAFSRSFSGIQIRCRVTSDEIPGEYFSVPSTVFVDRRVNYFASPSIITVPTGQVATIDATAFSTGGSISYQWQRSTNNGSTWSNLAGEVNPQIIVESPVNNHLYRAIISVPDATSYQFFTSSTGTQTINLSPPGSNIITVESRISIVAASLVATYYSEQTMKTGAAIGTVICLPKPKSYTASGFTGEDYLRWYETGSVGYSRKYIGYLPLTGPSINWNAAHYPELVRILGNKYGGSANGSYPNYTGNFRMPPVTGKVLMGTGNVDNNRSSASVVPLYQGNGQSGGSINEVGSIGGSYNYRRSEQLPPGSPGNSGQPDGTAGTSSLTPSTFSLGTFTTTGWNETESTIQTTFTERVNWSVGPLGGHTFGSPTLHTHGMSGWGVDVNVIGARGGGTQSANCRHIETDFGVWLSGPALLVGSNTNFSHVHGLSLSDASAEGIGHGTGRGGVGSDSISGSFTQLQSGSSLDDGNLTMSNQSNTLWNSVLSFYLRNNEALPVNYRYFRLRYFIKAW